MRWSAAAVVLLGMAAGYAAAGPAAGRDRWYRIGLAWPLGAGILGLMVLLSPGSQAGVARVAWAAAFLSGAALLASAVARRFPPPPDIVEPPSAGRRPRRGLWSAMLCVVLVNLVVLAVAAARDPHLTDWDAWAIWGMKARAFAAERSVDRYLERVDWYEFSWPDRPCLVSLVAAAVAIPGGGLDEGAVRFVHLMWFGSLLILFQRALRRSAPVDIAMVYTAALATTPNVSYHASAGLGNLPLGCYLFASLDALDRLRRERRPALVAAAAFLCGCAALSRDEGVVFIGLLLACVAIQWRPGRDPAALAALATAGIAAVAAFAAWRAGLTGRETVWSVWLDGGALERARSHLSEAPAVLSMVGAELLAPGAQMQASPMERHLGLAIFWPAFMLATLTKLSALARHPLGGPGAGLAFLGLLAFAGGLWLFPYQDLADLGQNWAFALDRHLVALVPVAACAIACALEAARDLRTARPMASARSSLPCSLR
jgi:hypothetical protein